MDSRYWNRQNYMETYLRKKVNSFSQDVVEQVDGK